MCEDNEWDEKKKIGKNSLLTLLGLQSRYGDKLLRIWLVCPQNVTAVLKEPVFFSRIYFNHDVEAGQRPVVCNRCVCVLHIKPFFLPVDIQHNQCPCRFSNPRRDTSSVVTKLRHRDSTLPRVQYAPQWAMVEVVKRETMFHTFETGRQDSS